MFGPIANSVGTACKNDISFTTTIPADIYVAGIKAFSTGLNAMYWKNGVATTLGIGNPYTYANDIFVSAGCLHV